MSLELRPIERRVLAHLEQRGGKVDRHRLVIELSPPDSRTVKVGNGSNGARTLIAGAWTRRLVKAGLVAELIRYDSGPRGRRFHEGFEITRAGREALRAQA